MTFTDRCAIATACLPRDDYRAKLEALHAEMLAELDRLHSSVEVEKRWRKDSDDRATDLEIALSAAIADERERCASLCEGLREAAEHSSDGLKRAGALSMATSCAKLIRAN